ncbi:MAG: hypothetical protein K8T90_18315 [Planctomycetes bacterium]|nr:hypothetical protein [Planctomycetota bacterium]
MGLKTIALWQAEVRAAENEAPGPQQFVQVEFDIPAEVPATGTPAARPIVWELIVHGRSTWGDVTEAFEVPVGERSSTHDSHR